MRSDEEVVRDLLARAAETIDVGPGRPLEAAPTRRTPTWSGWAVAVAAAAVVAVLVTVTLAAIRGSSGTGPSDPIPAPQASTYRLPSFFGVDLATARAELERRGVRVVAHSDLVGTCSPLAIVGSEPAVGTVLHPGDEVRLTTRGAGDGSATRSCPAEAADPSPLQLLRFVLGSRTVTVNWARSVQVSVNGTDVLTLSATQAADPDSWGRTLDGIRHASRQVRRTRSGTQLPTLEGGQIGFFDKTALPARLCGFRWPHLSIYESVIASVGWHGAPSCTRQRIQLFIDNGSYGFDRVAIYDPAIPPGVSSAWPTG